MQPLPRLDSVRVTAPEAEYRLQTGDILRIRFPYHPEHDTRLPIRPDGKIVLDITGEIQAAGLTSPQLAQIIVEKSSEYLRDPEVSVNVQQTFEQRVYVGGQVRAPGYVIYRPGLTPMQAILDRGGFTAVAEIDSVMHLKPRDNDYEAVRLDLTEVVEYGISEPVLLAAGDVLYVPRTWIGDAGNFVQLYVRDLLPIQPRFGFGP